MTAKKTAKAIVHALKKKLPNGYVVTLRDAFDSHKAGWDGAELIRLGVMRPDGAKEHFNFALNLAVREVSGNVNMDQVGRNPMVIATARDDAYAPVEYRLVDALVDFFVPYDERLAMAEKEFKRVRSK